MNLVDHLEYELEEAIKECKKKSSAYSKGQIRAFNRAITLVKSYITLFDAKLITKESEWQATARFFSSQDNKMGAYRYGCYLQGLLFSEDLFNEIFKSKRSK